MTRRPIHSNYTTVTTRINLLATSLPLLTTARFSASCCAPAGRAGPAQDQLPAAALSRQQAQLLLQAAAAASLLQAAAAWAAAHGPAARRRFAGRKCSSCCRPQLAWVGGWASLHQGAEHPCRCRPDSSKTGASCPLPCVRTPNKGPNTTSAGPLCSLLNYTAPRNRSSKNHQQKR